MLIVASPRYFQGLLLLKGVAQPEDAKRAAQQGIDGVIVSNHGGRQLDGAQASLETLPGVVEAVPADFTVIIDGGFRCGTDVLKAIALGARMVFLGRPMLYDATVAETAGEYSELRKFYEARSTVTWLCSAVARSRM